MSLKIMKKCVIFTCMVRKINIASIRPGKRIFFRLYFYSNLNYIIILTPCEEEFLKIYIIIYKHTVKNRIFLIKTRSVFLIKSGRETKEKG